MAKANRERKTRRNTAGDTRGFNDARAARDARSAPSGRSSELRDSPMMAHLLDALEDGKDVGHYGRLVFAMVARHFLGEDEIADLLSKQPGVKEEEARAMFRQVQEQDYNPPSRRRILEWQSQQDFPICPDPDDPRACNVYRELQFPDEIYERIEEYWQEKAGE